MVVVWYPEALNVIVVDWIGWIGDVYMRQGLKVGVFVCELEIKK